VLLEAMAIIEASPTRLALPIGVHYVSGQDGSASGT
jgi:hypothetical protein